MVPCTVLVEANAIVFAVKVPDMMMLLVEEILLDVGESILFYAITTLIMATKWRDGRLSRGLQWLRKAERWLSPSISNMTITHISYT